MCFSFKLNPALLLGHPLLCNKNNKTCSSKNIKKNKQIPRFKYLVKNAVGL